MTRVRAPSQLVSLAMAVGLALACGGSGNTTGGNVEDTAQQRYLEFAQDAAGVGETITVRGDGWSSSELVALYLLTDEQFASVTLPNYATQTVLIGETNAAEDGSVAFEFVLQESYEAATGEVFVVRPGTNLNIVGVQATEGGQHATGSGPLTVELTEGSRS